MAARAHAARRRVLIRYSGGSRRRRSSSCVERARDGEERRRAIAAAAGRAAERVCEGIRCPRRRAPVSSRGRAESWTLWDEANLDELRQDGETKTAFMLRLTLSHPAIHTVIVGSQNLEHLRQNAEAARRGPLSSEVYEEAKGRLAAVGGQRVGARPRGKGLLQGEAVRRARSAS